MKSTRLSFSILILALLGNAPLVWAGPFNANDIVAVLIGDSDPTKPTDPGNATVPVQLLEYLPTGLQASPVQSILMPNTASGANHALTLNNNRAGGGLNRSVDGRYLVMGGTDISAWATVPTPTVRTIARIDSLGLIDTTTSFSNAYVGATRIGIRSVASVDGSAFYVGGNGDGNNGVHYVPLGASTATPLADNASRHVAIAGGNLYLAKDQSMNQVGTGLPLPIDAPGVAQLPGVGAPGSNSNWNSPVFFDMNPSVPGVDTLYLGIQRSNSVELPAIVKFTFNGTTWTQVNSYDLGLNIGMLFLTGRIESGNVVLYGSTDNAGAPTFGNSLVRMVDNGALSTFETLATADARHGFRGVSLAPVPVPEPSTITLVACAVIGLPFVWRRARGRRS